MRVALLSDTHTNARNAKNVVEQLAPHIEGVERILHAGDITSPKLLELLADLAPVDAVAGNMDAPELQDRLGDFKVLQLAGFGVGLLHGWGQPQQVPDNVFEHFEHEHPGLDVLVFGHSHNALVERRGDVLLVNPGSPTDRHFAQYCSMAVLELNQTVNAHIVRL
jgi:uncharacterized protein